MIRVLLVIARLNIGGPAPHVTDLAKGLNPVRFQTRLVTGQVGANEGDMSDLARGLDWQIIPELGRDLAPLADAVTLLKLGSLIRRYRPHIVHTHTAKAGAVGRVAARLAGVPVVVHTFHGHTFRGYWGRIGSRLAVTTERALALFADRLIAVSDRVRDDLIEFRIAPPKKIVTVPLGLDLAPLTAVARSPDDSGPTIGIIGRLVPIKNHRLFLDMARRLIADGFGGRFVIVGDGELRATLEREAADLGNRISFTGWRRDLPQTYGALDVVVNTSLNEGTPVALIEAMAAGIPVVATAVGGVPDVVRHGETGWLAPPGDAAALADSVKLALTGGDRLVARARADVLQRFSKERLVTNMERLYDTLIEKSQAPTSKSQS